MVLFPVEFSKSAFELLIGDPRRAGGMYLHLISVEIVRVLKPKLSVDASSISNCLNNSIRKNVEYGDNCESKCIPNFPFL